jgi:hypothetical protein
MNSNKFVTVERGEKLGEKPLSYKALMLMIYHDNLLILFYIPIYELVLYLLVSIIMEPYLNPKIFGIVSIVAYPTMTNSTLEYKD